MPELQIGEELRQLNKNTEVVIALLLRLISRENASLSLKEQIQVLDELGVRPISIARMVGRTQKHVGKELVGIRRARK